MAYPGGGPAPRRRTGTVGSACSWSSPLLTRSARSLTERVSPALSDGSHPRTLSELGSDCRRAARPGRKMSPAGLARLRHC